MELTTQVENISLDQLDTMFGTKSATPGADDLLIGKNGGGDTPQFRLNESGNLPYIDIDKLDQLDIPAEEVEEEKKEEPKETIIPKEEPKEEEKEEPKEETSTEDQAQIKTILKSTVDYLVDKGLWQDFDGREDLDIDEETYAELAAKQEEAKVQNMFNELVDSTGDYGKAIINHIKRGGDPDEIIDIFKEQKQVEATDISDVDGQVSIVEKYYSEVLGWNKTRIDKHINRLRADEGELEEEAKDVQDKYTQVYKAQLAEIGRKEAEREEAAEKQRKEYRDTLTQTIDTFEELTDREKKLIKDSVLKFNKTLEDGTSVNDFYLKFYQIQRDPKQYVELIHFIMDKEGYNAKISKKLEGKVVDKTWKFIKGNGAVQKKGTQLPEHQESKTSKINFSGLLKK